ncbi:MAG: family 78 glycoside hydrolase catalytic domain [Clostridiales bacterium]|nr:family 78 glycoside hydrolase catalytic domain [Clostridiales bacterium]
MKSTDLFGSAKWLTPGDAVNTPYIRGEFSLDKDIKSAKITICGLGFFELFINGTRIGDDLYGTLVSDFHETPNEYCTAHLGEQLAHRIYVKELDIASELTNAANCIGVALAPGWYRCNVNNYGPVKLCFRILVEYTDDSCAEVLSGEWLKWTQSPIIGWNLYFGEHHDYNTYRLDGWNELGYDASSWNELTVIDAPDTEYYISDCPPDKVIRYITPKLLSETDDAFIYDIGENITGTPIIECRSDEICKIEFRVSERLNADGTIEDYTNHYQNSSFITDGSKRQYHLHFCWNGFRYVSVTKNAKIVSCAVTHSDVPVTSSFSSDNKLLDWIYNTFIRTQLDNMHCGIPSDCPHLEKRGYTGDGELICECVMMMLDAQKFYKKWLGDISDCQDRVSGHIQYTAPYVRSGGGPGGWGCAIAEVPYIYYKTYGDKAVLEEFLPKTLHYFDYLEAHSENDLVVSDQPGEWCLGDWCTPEEIAIPAPYVNNYFYVKTINRLIEFCNVLGKTELISDLEKRAEIKKAAIVREYFDNETGDFAKNIQGANAFAVDIGLGDERTLAHIVEHYQEKTWYDTGIFGTDILTRILFEHGYSQLAFDLLTSKGKYSFHEWMSSGCTTFPEYWTYLRSQNHPMFGAVVKYLFSFLLGISQENSGYDKLIIKPCFVDGLNHADGYITTVHGRVAVKYVKADEYISVKVEIPTGVPAKFVYGDKEIALSAGVNEFTLKR